MEKTIDTPECCPEFHPAHWDNKIFQWDSKKFLKDKVFTLFFMPLNFGQVMKRIMAKVGMAGSNVPEYLCLSEHTSPWNMDIFLAVDKDIAGAENVTLSGQYYCKVYEGPFRDTKKWHENFVKTLKDNGLQWKKIYYWYTTCPKCAKKYGKNYVVLFGSV